MTRATEAPMVDGDWQARAKQRKRRINNVVGGLFCMGLLAGFLVGFFEEGDAGLFSTNSVPPAVAIVAAVTFVIATTYGSWKLMKVSDELDRKINTSATVVAGNVLLIGYPAWFFLWKGGLVPTPDAFWIFCAAIGASMVSYGWQKFR